MTDKLKRALIFGISGQDGSNLADYLLSLDYEVHGVVRRSSYPNTYRIEHLMSLEEQEGSNFNISYGDVLDFSSMNKVIQKVMPEEIYYLTAQSHVGISFDNPISTLQYNTLGYLNLLEIVRDLKNKEKYSPKIYFAASSEMFGTSPPPQNEDTPMLPVSPYGVSKLASFNLSRVYRRSYDMFICNGILFNHSGPRRGLNFVTKKITRCLAEIVSGKRDKIVLGNLGSKRDEGDSADYVKVMHKMLQQDNPDDFVISTGETHAIEEFVAEAFNLLGLNWKDYVEISERYKRPFELPALQGDSSKARRILGFKPEKTFKDVIKEMLSTDLEEVADMTIEQAREKMKNE